MDVFSPSECLLRQFFRCSHHRSCPKSDEKDKKQEKKKKKSAKTKRDKINTSVMFVLKGFL